MKPMWSSLVINWHQNLGFKLYYFRLSIDTRYHPQPHPF